MKLHELKGTITAKRVLGVDASTKSYAWCLIEDGKVIDYGEFEFSGNSIYKKMQSAKAAAEKLAAMKPDYCAVEQIVFVNNRAVTIKLAYFVGILLGEMAGIDTVFDDVSPMTWMNFIGNGRFTKEEKLEMKRAHPGKTKTWHKTNRRKVRKQRTMDWAKEEYGIDVDNDNIADAVGVAHYADKELTDG
jgi:Holliday junction resolvasome RuvABC endonuclease subunit